MSEQNDRILRHTYGREQAITMTCGRYSAMILPELGGNLVAFQDVERGLNFVRTPSFDELELFKTDAPFTYGIPVLFPPNRIEDGKFAFREERYTFPVNEPSTGNHLHGLLYDQPWQVVQTTSSNAEVSVELVQEVDASSPVYRRFPHPFRMSVRYSLSEDGLRQDVAVRNTGTAAMPLMLAFHTNLNVPFTSQSRLSDYAIRLTIGERWEMSERMLPTGRRLALSQNEQKMQTSGVFPFFEPMDNHYTAQPQDGRNEMELTDERIGVRLVYDVGRKYKHWMVFNNHGEGEFICPEPQTCVVNAPNTGLSDEASGLIVLEPGASWSETSRFYVERVT